MCLTACLAPRLPSRDETFALNSGVPPDCSRKTVTRRVAENAQRDERSLQAPIWMVCRESYIRGRIFVREHARCWSSFEDLKRRNRLSVGPGCVRSEAVSIAQYQSRTQHSVDMS